MKLIDRYLLSTFASALGLVVVTLTALFTVMDLSGKFGRFLALRDMDTPRFMTRYYAVRLPLFLFQVLPAVTLFASMFTIMRLQKTNELVPMMTSGISLRRLSAVFIAGAAACAMTMAALDEFALPGLMTAIAETDEMLLSDRPARNVVAFDRKGRHVVVQEWNRRTWEMTGVRATMHRPDGRPVWDVNARRGVWNRERRRYILYEGTFEPYDRDGNPVFRTLPPDDRPKRYVEPIPPEGRELEADITPEDFQRRTFTLSGRFYRMGELFGLMRDYPHVPSFRMQFHAKFTTPLGALLLLFLGLPLVAGAHTPSYFRGIAMCLVLTICYYAAHFAFFQAGNRGEGWDPIVMAWLPTAFFGLLGLAGFLWMRS